MMMIQPRVDRNVVTAATHQDVTPRDHAATHQGVVVITTTVTTAMIKKTPDESLAHVAAQIEILLL